MHFRVGSDIPFEWQVDLVVDPADIQPVLKIFNIPVLLCSLKNAQNVFGLAILKLFPEERGVGSGGHG